MGSVIRAASLRGFVPLVEELGGDADGLLGRFGLARSSLDAPDGVLPISVHDRLLDVAAVELGCRDLGLRLAGRQGVGVLGPLAVAIESSATAAEALECASRFLFVHSPALSVGVRPDPRRSPGVVAVTYEKDVRESGYSPQAMELGVGLFFRIAVLLLGGSRGLRSVEFPHGPVSPVARYLEFFGVDVRFGAGVAALRVERRLLDEGVVGADGVARALAWEYLSGHHVDPAVLVSTRVRRVVAETLATGGGSLVGVARVLGVGPRTVQRRLRREGTSFEVVRAEVRREAAHRLITGTRLPLSQVAVLVGFGEQSSLVHAVRRWYGCSPSELRRS